MRVCVQGTCREFGCDGYQYSGVDFDNCRVCGGNGSTCRRVDGSIQLNLSEQRKIINVIPFAPKIYLFSVTTSKYHGLNGVVLSKRVPFWGEERRGLTLRRLVPLPFQCLSHKRPFPIYAISLLSRKNLSFVPERRQ